MAAPCPGQKQHVAAQAARRLPLAAPYCRRCPGHRSSRRWPASQRGLWPTPAPWLAAHHSALQQSDTPDERLGVLLLSNVQAACSLPCCKTLSTSTVVMPCATASHWADSCELVQQAGCCDITLHDRQLPLVPLMMLPVRLPAGSVQAPEQHQAAQSAPAGGSSCPGPSPPASDILCSQASCWQAPYIIAYLIRRCTICGSSCRQPSSRLTVEGHGALILVTPQAPNHNGVLVLHWPAQPK